MEQTETVFGNRDAAISQVTSQHQILPHAAISQHRCCDIAATSQMQDCRCIQNPNARRFHGTHENMNPVWTTSAANANVNLNTKGEPTAHLASVTDDICPVECSRIWVVGRMQCQSCGLLADFLSSNPGGFGRFTCGIFSKYFRELCMPHTSLLFYSEPKCASIPRNRFVDAAISQR